MESISKTLAKVSPSLPFCYCQYILTHSGLSAIIPIRLITFRGARPTRMQDHLSCIDLLLPGGRLQILGLQGLPLTPRLTGGRASHRDTASEL